MCQKMHGEGGQLFVCASHRGNCECCRKTIADILTSKAKRKTPQKNKKPCKNSDSYNLARPLRLNQHASTCCIAFLLQFRLRIIGQEEFASTKVRQRPAAIAMSGAKARGLQVWGLVLGQPLEFWGFTPLSPLIFCFSSPHSRPYPLAFCSNQDHWFANFPVRKWEEV